MHGPPLLSAPVGRPVCQGRSLAAAATAGGRKADRVEQSMARRGEANEPCGDGGDNVNDQKISHGASRVRRQLACALEEIVVSRFFLPAGRRASFRLITGRASPSCQCRPTILGGSSGGGG